MKRTSWGMRILLLLPILLASGLLAWVLAHYARGGGPDGGRGVENPGAKALGNPTSPAQMRIDQGQGGTQENTQAQSQAAPQGEDPVIHMVFAGDILLSDFVLRAYDKAGGIQGVLDQGFLKEVGQADVFMANEEFPFTSRGTPADKTYTFRLPPARVKLFQELGLKVVTLANNHALDFGRDGLLDSCSTLEDAGILHVGAGKDMDQARKLATMEVKGKTIGFLGASRVFPVADWVAGKDRPGMVSAYDPAVLLDEVEKAKGLCDYLVVYLHWGKERKDRPEDYQRSLGKKLIDAGADLVLGSHPHVLQGIEYYKGKPVVYSLGNFIFGSSIPRTALLKVDLAGGKASLSLVPGTSKDGFTRQVTDPGQLKEFYQYMEGLSYGVHIDGAGRVVLPES